MYRCEATSVAGFIQQLAVSYVANGYWFYVTGEIPARKDPRAVDTKLIARYHLDISKWTRCRQRKTGVASVQYLRHGSFFVLVATRGEHEFFTAEASRIRDIRRAPLRYGGYSVAGLLAGEKHRVSVRIERDAYSELKSRFLAMATGGSEAPLSDALQRVAFARYAPVRRQLAGLLRSINLIRRQQNLPPVSPREGWFWRPQLRPFVTDEGCLE